MLQSFMKLKAVISEIISEDSSSPEMPRPEELELIQQFTALLKPCINMIQEVLEQKYVSISKMISMLSRVKFEINNFCAILFSVNTVKQDIMEGIQKIFQFIENNDLTAISILLDPRLKNCHFQDAAACKRAIQTLKKFVQSELNKAPSTSNKKGLYDFCNHHNSLENELSQYLSCDVANITSNPLTEREGMKFTFPTLYKVAMRHSVIMANLVPCKSLFSEAATITKASNDFLSKHIEKLLFLATLRKEDFLCP